MLPSETELEQSLAAFNLHLLLLLNFKKWLFSFFFLSVPFNPYEAMGSILTCCVTQGATLNHWSSIFLEQPGLSPACIYLAFWWLTMKSSAAGVHCWHFSTVLVSFCSMSCIPSWSRSKGQQTGSNCVLCDFPHLIGGNVLTQNPPK